MASLGELEKIIKINPHAREFYQLALEYQKLGKFTEAKSVLLKGLEKNQGNFQARLLLTKIFIAESNFQEAKKQVERVLKIVPDNVTANHLAAEISESLGDNESALRYYKVVELFEPERQGIKEKIYELESNNKTIKDEIVVNKEELYEEKEEKIEIPIVKEDPISINEEEKQIEEESKGEIVESIFEEEKTDDKINLEDESSKNEDQSFSNGIKEEKIDESYPISNKDVLLSPLKNSFVGENVLEADKKISEVIREETLTDLLENASIQEKIEEKGNVIPEKQAIEEINQSAEINQEEESQLVGEEIFDENEVEKKEEVSSISTATLADLYEKQGYPEKAIEIYQHILLKEPEREDIRKRIEKLKKEMLGMQTQDDVGVVDVKSALRGKRIEALKEWLRKIREAGNV